MKLPDSLETSRLKLRQPLLSDAEAIFNGYAQDADVVKYLVWRPHKNIEETWGFLRFCLQAWQQGSAFPYVIENKESGQLLGMIEVRPERYRADIGYVLAKGFWGQGYMTEALAVLIRLTLAQPEIYRIGILCDVENIGSARVMEKAGLQKEGLLRRRLMHPNIGPEPRDGYLYSIVK